MSVNTTSAADQLHLLAARCCLQQSSKDSLELALGHLEELSEDNEESDTVRGLIYLALSDKDRLEAVLEKLKLNSTHATETEVLKAWIDFHNNNFAASSEKLEQCVQRDTTNADFLLKLGRALWEQRQNGTPIQDRCFNVLLKAAKLDPYLSEPFLYLGHFYAELKKDKQRARKCYQKAYDLDTSSEEAGAAMCDMMAALGEEEAVKSLLQTVTTTASAGSSKWAWLRLGLAQMRTGDETSAVTSFQSALRADPCDRHVWECLAEAYLHRGSYTAALKAFTKVVEMYPDSTYCHYQMANIKQKLGILMEAAAEYELILVRSADYVPALKGLGETYLLLAQRQLFKCMVGSAKCTCQQAIHCLTRAATQRPDLSCLWKLIGDCCVVLHHLHSSVRICVPRRLCQTVAKDDTEIVEISKMELLELGTKCYGKALNIFPESASLWHDLGQSFFYLCKEKSSSEDRKQLVDKSQQALKKALSIDPSNHAHWTALGVVAASDDVKNYSLAQHCFIKSIQNNASNAVAWTNLGAIYLLHDNIKLAHEAFKVAQSQDPEYVSSWIGQALVAEHVGHEEAMDLFRHTTELTIHMESCIGYGHWVISTLLDIKRQETEAFQFAIKQMAAIPAAADALARYTEIIKDDPCAFNMLGLILEHQGLYVSALAAFRRAVELAGRSGLLGDSLSKIKLNLARLLSQTEQYEESCSVYQAYVDSATFADLCQWGLVLYKAGHYDNSYSVYKQALELAKTDHDRSDVCAALGMVAFKLGNMNSAKEALFQGFQSQSPSVHGLLALCSLGLLQGDLDLARATLPELTARAGKGDVLVDVATLSAAIKVIQGEGIAAITEVECLLGEHSQVCGLHLLLSHLSLHFHSGFTAESSAKLAVKFGGSNNQAALLCMAMSQLQIGKHSRHFSTDNAVRMAQKAYHNRPDDLAALCCLIGAMHGEAIIRYVTRGDGTLLARELDLLDIAMTSAKVTSPQKCWCLKLKSLVQMFMAKMDGAGQTLHQLLTEFPNERELVSVLQCVLTKEQSSLEPLVIRDGSDLFFWQVLLSGLVKERKWMEAGLLLREALEKARADSMHAVKLLCLVTIAWVSVQNLLDGGDDGLRSDLEEACQAVEQLSKQPSAMLHSFQGLVCMDDNPRKAKHHFARALEEGQVRSSLGVELSLSRRGVIFLLHTSGKDQDQDLIQSLLSDAKAAGDKGTLEFYSKFCKK